MHDLTANRNLYSPELPLDCRRDVFRRRDKHCGHHRREAHFFTNTDPLRNRVRVLPHRRALNNRAGSAGFSRNSHTFRGLLVPRRSVWVALVDITARCFYGWLWQLLHLLLVMLIVFLWFTLTSFNRRGWVRGRDVSHQLNRG